MKILNKILNNFKEKVQEILDFEMTVYKIVTNSTEGYIEKEQYERCKVKKSNMKAFTAVIQ